MEKNLAYVWLNLLILAMVFDKGYSIKCYVCSSLNDPNCYDPISSNMKTSECTTDLSSSTLQRFRSIFTGFSDFTSFLSNVIPGGSFTCIKVEIVPAHAGGNSTVVRGCQFENEPADDICKRLSVKAHGQSFLKFCEVCNGDACNGAEGIGGASKLLSMLLPAVATFLYIRL